MQTDNGTEFTNEKVSKYLEVMEIEHTYSSPYHPQSNGSVEAFNKTIQNFLKKHMIIESLKKKNLILNLRHFNL